MKTSAKIGGVVAALMIAASGATFAAEQVNPYVHSTSGEIVKTGSGLCLRTGFWTPALAEALGVNGDGCACDADILDANACKVVEEPAPAKAAEKVTFSADMLYAATMGGAKALGWDKLIGSVEIGKAADLIAIDLSGVGTLPIQDPAAQLLYAADRENIVRTWANGELIASRDKTTGKTVWHKAEIRPEEIQTLAEKWQNRI